jgi:hypothetical protein
VGLCQSHNAADKSSNSTCSICCGFVVKQVVQQIQNKSTTFRLLDKSTADSQLHDKSYNLLYNKSTANPQEIEQVEFELKLVLKHSSDAQSTAAIASTRLRLSPAYMPWLMMNVSRSSKATRGSCFTLFFHLHEMIITNYGIVPVTIFQLPLRITTLRDCIFYEDLV